MKTKLIIIALLSAFIFTACEKEENKNLNSENHSVKKKSVDVNYNKANGATSAYKIYCGGTCDGSGGECHLVGTVGNGDVPTIVSCSCEGCAMHSEGIASLPLNAQLVSNLEYVNEDFDDYSSSTYPNQSVTISSVSFYEFNINKVFVQFEYIIEDVSVEGDVSFILEYNSNYSSLIKKTIVDCAGGCDDEGKTCRESFNTGSGEIACTCQGTCEMTITEVPTGG
jgi:hypothetical protein